MRCCPPVFLVAILLLIQFTCAEPEHAGLRSSDYAGNLFLVMADPSTPQQEYYSVFFLINYSDIYLSDVSLVKQDLSFNALSNIVSHSAHTQIRTDQQGNHFRYSIPSGASICTPNRLYTSLYFALQNKSTKISRDTEFGHAIMRCSASADSFILLKSTPGYLLGNPYLHYVNCTDELMQDPIVKSACQQALEPCSYMGYVPTEERLAGCPVPFMQPPSDIFVPSDSDKINMTIDENQKKIQNQSDPFKNLLTNFLKLFIPTSTNFTPLVGIPEDTDCITGWPGREGETIHINEDNYACDLFEVTDLRLVSIANQTVQCYENNCTGTCHSYCNRALEESGAKTQKDATHFKDFAGRYLIYGFGGAKEYMNGYFNAEINCGQGYGECEPIGNFNENVQELECKEPVGSLMDGQAI